MNRSVTLLVVLFVSIVLVAQSKSTTDSSKQDKAESATTAKQDRWQGHILRINKDKSTIDVRGGRKNLDQTQRTIQYDESTEWTKLGKPAQMSEFKEGSFVIVLGQSDKKGSFHASRIDLRLPR
jgi:hypothetical protein